MSNSVLVGWNVGLICAFVTVIAIGIGSSQMGNPINGAAGIGVTLGAATIVGALAGTVVGRRVWTWFARRTSQRGYFWFVVLLVITVFSLPTPFNFGLH